MSANKSLFVLSHDGVALPARFRSARVNPKRSDNKSRVITVGNVILPFIAAIYIHNCNDEKFQNVLLSLIYNILAVKSFRALIRKRTMGDH